MAYIRKNTYTLKKENRKYRRKSRVFLKTPVNAKAECSNSRREFIENQTYTTDNILELFAGISFDSLVSFESQLYEDPIFAIKHSVGRRIYKIIEEWDKFIGFDGNEYYHARKIENERGVFLDQEMVKVPLNIASHGRYNAVGQSSYYISQTREGAVEGIIGHSKGTNQRIQVVGLKPIKTAKILDLSKDCQEHNYFAKMLRQRGENENLKIVKEYLLPNFVASCCKEIGIDGIKYRNNNICNYVVWEDQYFEFIEGSREIIICE